MEEIIRLKNEKQRELEAFEDRHKEIIAKYRVMVNKLMELTNHANKELLKESKLKNC
jgi:hypothetical protein